MLELARTQLGMKVAWLSSFEGGDQVLRDVVGDTDPFGVEAGTRTPLDGSYCIRVTDGRLPNAIPDAREHPVTSTLPVTDELNIGSYVGVPVRDEQDEVLGMLCCIDDEPGDGPSTARLEQMELLAGIVAIEMRAAKSESEALAARRERVERWLGPDGFTMHGQPIVDLRDGRVDSVEMLARFDDGPPVVCFEEASAVGLGTELELAAVRRGLGELDRLPDGVSMSLNVSPELLVTDSLVDAVGEVDGARVVLELTEHVAVNDYVALLAAVERFRGLGVRFAVDDAGAGFASFRHVVELRPECIKLDISLVRDIDDDVAQRALVSSWTVLAEQIGAEVLAEGIEHEAERTTLVELGIRRGQGYLLARPAPLDDLRLPRTPRGGRPQDAHAID